MNKSQARQISKSGITYGEIIEMLKRAYDDGAAKNIRSIINPTMSKGTCFNILWKGHINRPLEDIISGINQLGAGNALREFGRYWEGEIPQQSPHEKYEGVFYHQEPINIYEQEKNL